MKIFYLFFCPTYNEDNICQMILKILMVDDDNVKLAVDVEISCAHLQNSIEALKEFSDYFPIYL